jgi:hypothetical protein
MSRVGIPQPKHSDIVSLLSTYLQEPVKTQEFSTLARKRAVPSAKVMAWEPELCLETKKAIFLVHQLIQDEIPPEVTRVHQANLTGRRGSRRLIPVIYCADSEEISAVKRAELVVEKCMQVGCALVCDSPEGPVLILPPNCRRPAPCENETEQGHIPAWLLNSLQSLAAFSDYFRSCLKGVHKSYMRHVHDGPADYDSEAEILIKFLQCLRKGDPRLFMPLDRFQALKSWERANANVKSRDHFFHTINNLLLGFLVLGQVFEKAERVQIPEKYIQQTNGPAKLLAWEALWFLTCINHDPAYSAEHFWSNYAYSIGIPGTATSEPIPEEVVEYLVEAWDTTYKGARQDLSQLYNNVRGKWDPPQLVPHDPAFDRALREAYWNGEKSSHSLISGLMLVMGCLHDRAAKSKQYDKTIALKACDIAALSMMFHDQHCRQVLATNDVQAISFDVLPYASALMFVDSLQDDRRDISTMEFTKHGILVSIHYDKTANEVVADVCLSELPLKFWPSKIVEYESATRWINSVSKTHFRIDYKTRLTAGGIKGPKKGRYSPNKPQFHRKKTRKSGRKRTSARRN